MTSAHQFPIRIYYEDTDAGGIVYYANYLRFFERARTEWLRDLGIEQDQLLAQNIAFVVRKVEMENKAPARFNQLVTVHSTLSKVQKASIVFQQVLVDDTNKILVTAAVKVACVDIANMKPQAIPADIIKEFNHVS